MKHPIFLFSSLMAVCVPVVAFGGEFGGRLEPMFEAHCYGCHDQDEKKGGLDLGALRWNPADGENLHQWTRVFDKVKNGQMPPKKKTRPSSELKSPFEQTLQTALLDFNRGQQVKEGRVVLRRLNRAEYINTVRDLFGVPAELKELLPQDGTEGGFDTIGAAQNLSVEHLDRYLEAADIVLREATVRTPKPELARERNDLSELWHRSMGDSRQLNWGFSPEGVLAVRNFMGINNTALGWKPPVPEATYRFRVRARAMLDDAQDGGVGKRKRINPAQPMTAKVGQQGVHIAGVWPKAGPDPRINLKLGLGASGGVKPFTTGQYYEMSPTEYREFVYEARVPAGQTLRLQAYRTIPDEPGEEGGIYHGLCAVVEWVEIEGPLLDQWPPRGHQFLYGDLPLVPLDVKQPQKELIVTSASPEADARRLLGGFLTKIFRRAATVAEVEEHVGIFKEHLQSGMRFDEALRMAYKLALCSPEFLFFAEQPGQLSDNALGTRLSYALWGGPPDAALAELAAQGKLHEPGVLREQTDRLLADPRSNRFVSSFLDSWLNLRDINATQPDTKLFTEFEDYLRDSMVDESVAFFGELVRENLGVKNVVHSDFAMLNERLAEHYGIPGVRGVEIRKVALPERSRRGGLLTQGAVLKVSANGTSTSPVVRGAYVLARFLGTPPEPPPKSVPAIEPDIRGATTIREQLEKHRADATCATCHATLDPPGFALENYDVTGRWRTNYRTLPESAKGRVVTIAGCDARLFAEGPKVLPGYKLEDGRAFEDIDGFKQLLLSNQEQLALAFTEKLVAHLTGARMQFADRDVVSEVVKRAQKDGYGVRSLIHEVIQSRLFCEK
ncbi:MAG: DUF1592 domain-containing protein [Verrucomicrobiota bacterium]